LASAKAAKMARTFAIRSNLGGSSVPSTVDFGKVKDYFQTNQQRIYERDDSPQALAKFNVGTIQGKATLTSPNTLSVSTSTSPATTIVAKEGIILCTGATPKKPSETDIPGLDTVEAVTYENIWKLDRLPKTLTVVGGGPIGVELAQALSRLGSKVTIIADRLLPREEPEASDILEQIFVEDEGIRVVKGRLLRVEKGSVDGSHVAFVGGKDGREPQAVEGDVMLLSVGRIPNTDGLGLEDMGIKLNDKAGIAVNNKLQTSVKGIYAAGDCTGDRQFTHYAGK
jgi:pyruvate/2-oxoglutarate dehydrogenase complex dihydrolipoamide dehydrogenase (E3) component